MIYQKNELVGLAADIATSEGIPPELCLALIEVLSAWNPALIEQSLDPQQYNPALARNIVPNARLGLLQVNPESVKEQLGYKGERDGLLEPTLNVSFGCRLLKKALETTGGNIDRALLCVYGYSISSLIPKIQAKVKPYREFIEQRPSLVR